MQTHSQIHRINSETTRQMTQSPVEVLAIHMGIPALSFASGSSLTLGVLKTH